MYAYSDNGISWRFWKEPLPLAPGEVLFPDMPTAMDLAKKFPGYAAAAAARQVEDTRVVRRKLLQAAQKAGLVVMSGTPGVSGTYGTSPQDEINLVALSGKFPGHYRDMIGVKHEMSAAKFALLVDAITKHIAACDHAYSTGADFPSAKVTI